MKSTRAGNDDKVVIVNAEKAVVSGKPDSVFATYHEKYALNHARKGPYFPRMPDMILKRTVRGMLPYQAKSSGRRALRNLRVEIGCPSHLLGTFQKVTRTVTTARFDANYHCDSYALVILAPT